jgi:hypothetical protein
MLYTVLGLYDPAELAIDAQLIPSHHGLRPRKIVFGASRMPVETGPIPNQLGTASVANARVC